MKNNKILPEPMSLIQKNQRKFAGTNRICYLFDFSSLASKIVVTLKCPFFLNDSYLVK